MLHSEGIQTLTSIDVLLDDLLSSALVHLSDGLRLERLAVLAGVEHARRVHGALERIALPAEHVIGVGAVGMAFLVAVAEDEGVGAVGWPHVLKLGSVPERLVGELGHANGVRRRALGACAEAGGLRVVHVRLVVGAIKILAVPAAATG